MKKIQLITKGIVKNSPQKAALKMLSPLKKSLYKYRKGKVLDGTMARWPDGTMARWHDGDLPGVDHNQATVQDNHSLRLGLMKMLSQLIVQWMSPTMLGVAAAASPHRKSTTGLKRREAKPASAQLQTC